ncbi:MAG: 50S ribosomal protein L19 [bacterium]|nr:50S ribosomal protein L19 [bacterium]
MDLIQRIESEQIELIDSARTEANKDQKHVKEILPDFGPGDTVKAWLKVVEGGKERLQAFEGICLKRGNSGLKETFTLRKVSGGVGVERTLLIHSPRLVRVEVTRRGDVRRARLFYLRDRVGKKARVKEKRFIASK